MNDLELNAADAQASAEESYGLGFWIGPDRTTVQLEGEDAGASLRTGANPVSGLRYCLIAHHSTDVSPLASIVDRHIHLSAAG